MINYRLPKKAQMEMIGLVVIVILLTLGMLFMAQFALKEDNTKKVFTSKGLAYSTMSALMEVTIASNCGGEYAGTNPRLKDILQDCAVNYNELRSLYSCNGQHSCAFLNETIATFLNQTLGTWGKHYEFKSRLLRVAGDITPPDLINIKGKEGCPLTKDRDSTNQPLNSEAGQIISELNLCD